MLKIIVRIMDCKRIFLTKADIMLNFIRANLKKYRKTILCLIFVLKDLVFKQFLLIIFLINL